MQNNSIVCFAGNDWWVHNPLTEKQWMRALARRGISVLFVNSIGVGLPGKGSPYILRRLLRKIKSLSYWLRRDEGVWVLTPLLLPLWSVAVVRRMNVFLITLQIRHAMKRAGMAPGIFWAGLPTAALLLRQVPHRQCVYYVQDDYLSYSTFDNQMFMRLHEDHDDMLRAADLVICASIGLVERESQVARRVEYVPQGIHPVFLDHGLTAADSIPNALKDISRPIIGYWGSLESLHDRDLVKALALRHPEWSFVFFGRKMTDVSELEALPNVHYPGFLPIEDIPRHGVHFDVGLISFKQTEFTYYGAPIKFREYLALGLPVVAPPMVEVEKAYEGEGLTARTVEEFSARIREAMDSDSPNRREHRRQLVAGMTWEASSEHVFRLLASLEEEA
ncbi:MAG: glycosyltransferase [Bacteroidetes bacterium]|nr:glycosyltransferase [Bacteroidota bacterium]